MKKESKKKENRGGARPGSGQPKKAPTKTVSFRVRVEFVEPLKKLVKDAIDEYKTINASIVNERKDRGGSWVSVEDRLPDVKKDGNKVLLFREMNESQKALSICVYDTSMIKYCEKSSYWMPLPAPPVPKIQ